MTVAKGSRTQTRSIMIVALITAVLLMVPLLAMHFNDDVNWTVFDFIVAAILLFGTGLAYVLLAARASTSRARLVIGAVLFAVLATIWAQLAVGIFGPG